MILRNVLVCTATVSAVAVASIGLGAASGTAAVPAAAPTASTAAAVSQPAPPSDLYVIDCDPARGLVRLGWTASPSAVAGYDVYLDGVRATGTTTALAVVVANVTGTGAHSFMVKARDAAGHQSSGSPSLAWSMPASTTVAPRPNYDLAPVAGGITATSVALAWHAPAGVSGITGYQVLVRNKVLVTTAATTATVTGLTPLTPYEFAVQALVGTIPAPQSDWYPVRTLDAESSAFPAPPTAFRFVTRTDSTIRFTWNASTSAVVGYDLFLNGARVTGTRTATAVTVTNLPPHRWPGQFTLRARDARGVWSDPALYQPTAASQAAPTGLRVVKVTSTNATISWTPPAGAGAYMTYVLDINGQQFEVGSETTVTTPDWAAGSTLVVRVIAISGEGVSSNPSDPLTIVLAKAGTAGELSSGVRVRWNRFGTIIAAPWSGRVTKPAEGWYATFSGPAVKGAKSYRVYLNGRQVTTRAFRVSASRWSVDLVSTAWSVKPGDKLQVAAVIAGKVGGASDAVTVVDPHSPDTLAPTAPSGFKATGLHDRWVDVAFTGADDNVAIDHYTVARNGKRIFDVRTPGFSDGPTLKPGTTYTYVVTAVDAAGNKTAGKAFRVRTARAATVAAPKHASVRYDGTSSAGPAKLRFFLDRAVGFRVVVWAEHQHVDLIPASGKVAVRSGRQVSATLSGLPTRGPLYVALVDAKGHTSAPVTLVLPAYSAKDTAAPSVPTKLVAGPASVKAGKAAVTVTWQPSRDRLWVARYEVTVDGVAVVQNAAALGQAATTARLSGLAAGTTHTVSVVAIDGKGNRSKPATVVVKG